MKRIQMQSYGKINLCLDVLGRLENGYHQVEMVMQQIMLHDDVDIKWYDRDESQINDENSRALAGRDDFQIEVSTNRPYLPRDERNLAYKAAVLMHDLYGRDKCGKVRIDIKKRIPVAAGLAGGSGNGAAVLHGLNRLWDLGLDIQALCAVGSRLGSDVPFSLMGQAKMVDELGLAGDPLAAHCAIARGTGTDLEPIRGLKSYLVLTKPPLAVSTAEVYQGLDLDAVEQRPDIPAMKQALKEKNLPVIEKNMINVLENFTLKRYPSVMYTKNNMKKLFGQGAVLMSGSGPTVFGLCADRNTARRAYSVLKQENRETFWTRTTY